ncbi:rod shape-determining protein MreC [candidate division KSB1 bacterium]
MSFLQQNKYSRRTKSRFPKQFLVIGALAIFMILFNNFTLGGVSRLLHSVGGPIWKTQAGVINASQNIFIGLKDKQDLLYENRELREKITRLELTSIVAKVLRQENEDLRRSLNREDSRELIAAAVLARPNRTLYDTFIVDVGRRDGVTKESRVFGVGDVAVGSVEEVYARTSLISLYSTPGRSMEVLLGDGESEVIAVEAVGRGGGDFEIHIPRGIEVFAGHAIFSPELDGGILGVIEEIIALPSDSFQTVLFSSPVNIQSLRIVTIQL